jgi:hypothetical protein
MMTKKKALRELVQAAVNWRATLHHMLSTESMEQKRRDEIATDITDITDAVRVMTRKENPS